MQNLRIIILLVAATILTGCGSGSGTGYTRSESDRETEQLIIDSAIQSSVIDQSWGYDSSSSYGSGY